MKFYEQFRRLSCENGEYPSDICKKLGLSSGTYSHWKNGTKYPRVEILVRIADYFDCSVDYLLGRTDIKNSVKR